MVANSPDFLSVAWCKTCSDGVPPEYVVDACKIMMTGLSKKTAIAFTMPTLARFR
jgi:hypothetical protein